MENFEKSITNLARLHATDDEALVETAKYLNALSLKGLRELRNLYNQIPVELVPQEQFLKDIISASAIYLAETNNWYDKFKGEEL